MCNFTDREFELLLNSTHERSMRLLDHLNNIAQKSYRNLNEKQPTKEDVDIVYTEYKEHVDLVKKIREMKNIKG